MAITVTLTCTQAANLSMTVLVLSNASGEGAWQANGTDVSATVTPGSSGSMIVGASATHWGSNPGYFTPLTGTTFDQDSQGINREGGGWHNSTPATAGTPVTGGAASSGLYDNKCAVAVEILPSGGGAISIDASSPAPLPAAGQNSQLSVGGTITSRTSASFTPPPSAVLVVLATASGTPSIATFLASESSGLYTWTRDAQANDSGGANYSTAMVLIGVPPTPPPSGTGTATVQLAGSGSGSKRASGSGTAHLALAGAPSGRKQAAGTGAATVALRATGTAFAAGPEVVVGTRTLMFALVELEQQTQGGRLPNVAPSQPFWCRSSQAARLVAAGLAAYAPSGTQLRPEPPYTTTMVPGLARGTSNASR